MRTTKVDPQVLAAVTRVPEIARQVQQAAAKIRDDARAKAPVKTGALRRSIKVQRAYDRGTKTVSYHVGWDKDIAYYGPMVELGTEKTPARPHLRPAADEFNR